MRMMKLPEIEADKANHFIYGLLIYAAFAFALGDLAGSAACIAAAFGKEAYDHFSPNHRWCWLDIAWTLLGGIAAFLIRIG